MTQSVRRAEDLDLRKCILLDSESTVHAFCNEKLVEEIWDVKNTMTLVSNGGSIDTINSAQ